MTPRGDRPPTRREWRTNEEWDRLHRRIGAAGRDPEVVSPSRVRLPATWIGVAAAAIAAVVFALRVPARTDTRAPFRVATTGPGERIVIHLADSSVVTLGPRSILRYRVGKTTREAELEGMAAFTIAHNPARRFIVHARNGTATDLGTKFMVRAYPTDTVVEVAVTQGAVSLAGTDARQVELRAGSVGRVSASGAATTGRDARALTDTAWIDGRLAFDDARLADVAAELTRWFGVDIRVSNRALGERHVTAIYNTPKLEDVLGALSATLGIRVDRQSSVITLTPRSP